VRVEVRLFASLSRHLPPGAERSVAILDVPDGATIRSVARSLGISEDMPSIVLVNDRDTDLDHRLVPGDVLAMFPPLAGGL
jgi:sulfur-carrier protein